MINKEQLSELGLFDTRAPRYTSYPTAPQFKNDISHEIFSRWVQEIPEGSSISLYIHIPFCRRLCWFCACRTQGTSSDRPVQSYVKTLQKELRLLSLNAPRGVRLSHLHWGGGTPTILPPELIGQLVKSIKQSFPFTSDAEFSVEIDPSEVDDARLDALTAAGMTRASIGVQDFDPLIQKTIGRLQSFEETRDVIEKLRTLGVHSINADLVYGLPYQSKRRMTDTIQKLVFLAPDRIALYGYAHVPWMAKRQQLIPEKSLPSTKERFELFETASKMLHWSGYKQIGIDHFATASDSLTHAHNTGALRRNFQGYTNDPATALIGLGASAISRFPQGYAQNAAATKTYAAAIEDGHFATTRGHAFQGDDLMRGRMIESLMCEFRIQTAEICDTFDKSPDEIRAVFDSVNAQFDGLLTVDETGLEIPRALHPLTRVIASRFDAYAMGDTSGYSTAI